MPTMTRLLTLLTSATMMVSNALYTVAPHQNPDGLLFLVNRQYTLSEEQMNAVLEMSRNDESTVIGQKIF